LAEVHIPYYSTTALDLHQSSIAAIAFTNFKLSAIR